jgi:opacity protein-like surface antigen
MRRYLFLALIILCPALASAQSVEIFGVTGGIQLWDDEGNIGFGVPFGGGVGFKSPHGWGVEGLVERQKAERNFSSGVRFDSTVTAARGRLLKYFGSGRIQPYAGGGIGVTRVESARTEPPGFGGVFRSDKTSGTFSGFAGVRIPAGSRLFVRPEFEISRGGEHTRLGGNVAVGVAW